MGRGMAIPSMSQHMSPHVQAMAPGHTPIPPDGPVVANGAWVASGCSPEVTKRKIKVVGPIRARIFLGVNCGVHTTGEWTFPTQLQSQHTPRSDDLCPGSRPTFVLFGPARPVGCHGSITDAEQPDLGARNVADFEAFVRRVVALAGSGAGFNLEDVHLSCVSIRYFRPPLGPPRVFF